MAFLAAVCELLNINQLVRQSIDVELGLGNGGSDNVIGGAGSLPDLA